MRIIIAFPPLSSQKGIPLLAQNRQFQWAKTPWTAYPMVPASAATLLDKSDHQVLWADGITKGQTYSTWEKEVIKFKPDLIFIESKTPVIKTHWKIINSLKKKLKKTIFVLAGDHLTALPKESFLHSKVDYVLTGGDYDFLLLSLVNHLSKREKLSPGIYYRAKSQIRSTGPSKLNHSLEDLPLIDRDLTQYKLYAYKNSNYAYTPGTYTMFARDCWWGRCTFCSWTTLYPGKHYRQISPQKALKEVGQLIEKYSIKEIMDDSGTLPVGSWLQTFCKGMIKSGLNKKIKISCNMRFNSGLSQKDFSLMKKAGFRLLLFGLESSNQKTLDRLNKNLKVTQIIPALKKAKKAGLRPHITVMVGYPWETKDDIRNTLSFAKKIFKDGLADSLQATIITPYPGTPLFKEAQKENWLKTTNWDDYDMKQPVLKTSLSDNQLQSLTRSLYSSFFTPQFLIKKTREALSDPKVFKYYIRLALKFPSKLLDFKS